VQTTYDALSGAKRAVDNTGDTSKAVEADEEEGTDVDKDAANTEDIPKSQPTRITGTSCKWQRADWLTSASSLLPSIGASLSTLGKGVALTVTHPAHLRRVVWHRKGDYCATVAPGAAQVRRLGIILFMVD
jgi:hypothetical protein